VNFNHDTGLVDSLLTIDTTVAPPLGGLTNTLAITGTGSLVLPHGSTAERPGTPVEAMIRYNNSTQDLEFYDGTSWVEVSSSVGTVTSVTVTTSTGMTVSGGVTQTVTDNGTFALVLSPELQGLSALAVTGIVTRTAAGTYVSRTIAGTAGDIVVANGDGVSGNPTLSLATVGTPVSNGFLKITTDTKGRVTGTTAVTTADVTTLVDGTYVNISGDTMASGANLTFTGGGEILGLPAMPSDPTSAASKAYVDATAQGLATKDSVRVATTGPGTLSSSFANGQTVDGIVLVTGDRILIKNQTSQAENGIYVVQAAGTPVRAVDMDIWAEVPGAYCFVSGGTLNHDTGWVCTSQPGGTINVNPITFTQFFGAGAYTAGVGLTLNGTEFSLTSPVATTLGGTGLTTVGGANTVLGVNAAGTAYQAKTIAAGTGVSVTHSTGTITLANTGVTSVAGTAGRVTVSGSTGDVTISLPNDVSVASVTATGLTPNGALFASAGGLVSSTTAMTNGQLLIGNTGTTPSVATLATGTGISVTNGAGTITLANTGVTSLTAGTGISLSGATGAITVTNTGVTSVNASGGTTGLSFSGGPVTTTGTLTLGGTLAPSNGGTGLTALGVANSVLGVNAAASSAEYKTVEAGTGISVTHSAGQITVANTGVTSVGLAAPSIFTVAGTPVTTTGTLTLSLATQTANTVFAGPTSGGSAAPTFRSLVYNDLPIALYKENPSTPTAPVASGTNAIAIGSGSSATAQGGLALGIGSAARVYGQVAVANGQFTSVGDAQQGTYIFRNITTNATQTELFLDGVTGTQRLVMPNNSAMTFSILVTGRRTDAVGGGAGYRIDGVARKDATAASATIIGAVVKSVLGETNAAWDVTVDADTTNGSLRVRVTGEAAKTIRWVAVATTAEVTN